MSRFALLFFASTTISTVVAGPPDQSPVTADKPDKDKILAFMADWCEPCQKMRPTLATLEREGYSIEIIDIEENRQLTKQHDVVALPTFIAIGRNGEYWRHVGAIAENDLRHRLVNAHQGPAVPDLFANAHREDDGDNEPYLPGAISTETLLRVTYDLPENQAKALVNFLKDQAEQDFDATIKEHRLTITASPSFQTVLGPFINSILRNELGEENETRRTKMEDGSELFSIFHPQFSASPVSPTPPSPK